MRTRILVVLCSLLLAVSVYAEGPCASGRLVQGDDGRGLDQSWGPDGCGYRAKDSNEPGGPEVQWLDISGFGTEVNGLADDNIVGSFAIGFPFHYYWYNVHQFWIGSNGYIKFSSPGMMVAPLPTFPNAAPPNDVIGPYVADWVFGPEDSSRCYYWSNHADTLVVMWKSIEPYSGTDRFNFEMILCAVDSSITFQYGSREGTHALPVGAIAGIEDLNGLCGLTTGYGFGPRFNYAIHFASPVGGAQSGHDMAVLAVQNPQSAGYFLVPGDVVHPWVQIANLGAYAEPACSLHFVIRRPNHTVLAAFDTTLGATNPLDTLTVAWQREWVAADTGTYLAEAVVEISDDHVARNDTQRAEIHVAPVGGELGYDDGVADREAGWMFPAGHAMAMQFAPPVYPVALTQVRIYNMWVDDFSYDLSILAGDGPGGAPGTELWRRTVTVTSGWTSADLPVDSVIIRSGTFYVASWVPSQCGFFLDTTSAQGISHRLWEYYPNGGWEQARWWAGGELMVRASYRAIFAPPAPFTRLEPADQSSQTWLQGEIPFRWTASRDSGATVTYHLTIHSGDYSRTIATTDTFYADSCDWFYLGNPRADVQWSVMATNGVDSTSATNGEGYFWLFTLGAPQEAPSLITEYALSSYPNPFNSTAAIRYDLPQASQVELKVYNLMGEQVALLQQGYRAPGRYRIEWNAAAQGSGTYFAVLKAGSTTKIQKLLLMK
ncbi:MAG TPA: T9SS type A sorting domain-containing protein [bacterium]|jgi:hypothetical protein